MIIETLGISYTVMKCDFSDSNLERFICQEETGKKVVIIRIKNKEWIVESMEFFMHQTENRSFTDFISCFVSEKYLHIVLRYAEGVTLVQKLAKEECSLDERLVIGRGILDKVILQNIPYYFLKDCMKPENIIISPGMDINFQYTISAGVEAIKFEEVQTGILQLFERLFWKEIRQGLTPPSDFCSCLRRGEPQNIMEIYTAYDIMCKTIRDSDTEEMQMPRKRLVLSWDWVKGCAGTLQKICAVLLMLLAIVFLIYAVRSLGDDSGTRENFSYIGTLEIKSSP